MPEVLLETYIIYDCSLKHNLFQEHIPSLIASMLHTDLQKALLTEYLHDIKLLADKYIGSTYPVISSMKFRRPFTRNSSEVEHSSKFHSLLNMKHMNSLPLCFSGILVHLQKK